MLFGKETLYIVYVVVDTAYCFFRRLHIYIAWASYDEQIHGRPPRLRVGQGRYRMMPAGAQLMCDFPDTMMLMISNIVWERADLGHGNSLDDIYRDHGIQQDYILLSRPRGSTLHLLDVTPLDRGLYRCIASALDPNTGNTVTLFQDVHFYPIF
ncbi:uncharacterized protein LOC142329323 isoform X2 [Lycorma delicatula]|uniref:uncharacterized protein LOC142329323 isoform X2 n=1 Tax=Lycorma delicatula TaxID=130591 RepID=UPI003F51750C